MLIRSLDEWKSYCRHVEPRSDRDRFVRSSQWASGGITPPPALEDPAARIPLERAEELERLADEETPEAGCPHLELAIAWLEHPHPRASRDLRAAMRRAHDRLQDRLAAVDAEPD